MTKIIVGFAIFILILSALFLTGAFQNQKRGLSPSIRPSPKQTQAVSVVAENLEVPWALAFLPNGNMIVTERPGRALLIDKDGKEIQIASINVRTTGESGLHGVAVDPDFNSNNYIYLYYTYSDEANNTLNRVVRYRLENNRLFEDKIIADKISGAPNHDGGRIKFGPDGFLYITTGDAQEPSLAQDKNSLSGKIMRVKRDGNNVPDNPFRTKIYSYGHRNPQGITWDLRGQLWSTEHGPSGGTFGTGNDELNKIFAGRNYGWPIIQGDETRTGMETPVINSGRADTWAPAGAAFLPAQAGFGSIFFAGLRGEALYEYKIGEQKLVEHFKNEYGRLREVIVGPDNMLYITTSNRDGRGNPRGGDDKILRIDPSVL